MAGEAIAFVTVFLSPLINYRSSLSLTRTPRYNLFQYGLQGNAEFFNKVAKLKGAKVHDIWKGGYIYAKPNGLKDYDWQYWTTYDIETEQAVDVAVPIDSDRTVKVMALNATNDFTDGNPSGGGCVAAITYAAMLEWVTQVRRRFLDLGEQSIVNMGPHAAYQPFSGDN